MTNTTSSKPDNRVITDQKLTPIPLTDRWGTFNNADHTAQYWLAPVGHTENVTGHSILETLATLTSLYGGTPEPLLGDPRRYMDSSEDSFVAVLVADDGRLAIGIHHEMELDTDGCDDEQRLEIAQSWRGELDRLAELFPHSTFYAAFGEFTYEGRVTINAFTPLLNGIVGADQVAEAKDHILMSPYLKGHESNAAMAACKTLSDLPEVLREMIYTDCAADAAVNAVVLAHQEKANA